MGGFSSISSFDKQLSAVYQNSFVAWKVLYSGDLKSEHVWFLYGDMCGI